MVRGSICKRQFARKKGRNHSRHLAVNGNLFPRNGNPAGLPGRIVRLLTTTAGTPRTSAGEPSTWPGLLKRPFRERSSSGRRDAFCSKLMRALFEYR